MRTTEATRPTGTSLFAAATRRVAQAVIAVLAPLLFGLELLFEGYGRWRQRQALGRLDDHLLKDIGLTRSDVDTEISKPFWKG